MKRGATAAAALVIAFTNAAHADTPPNIWDLGKHPEAFQQRREHLDLEQRMEMLDDFKEIGGRTKEEFMPDALRGATRALDESRAPKDRWLQFDEAMIAMYRGESLGPLKEGLKYYENAITILEPLTKAFDGTFFVSEVWQKLAECYVRVERTADEIHAYDEVIRRAVVAEGTATPLLNQGEAYMRHGDIDIAVSQFKEVFRLAGTMPAGNDLGVLAQWDLAVALDRSGDESGALAAAKSAIHMDGRCFAITTGHTAVITTKCTGDDIAFIIIPPGLFPVSEENKDFVYFVPEYERSWYLTLGREALALEAGKPREAAENWKWAETEMMSYVSAATTHGSDKWLDLARKRLDAIRKRRLAADKRAGITPKDDADLPL